MDKQYFNDYISQCKNLLGKLKKINKQMDRVIYTRDAFFKSLDGGFPTDTQDETVQSIAEQIEKEIDLFVSYFEENDEDGK